MHNGAAARASNGRVDDDQFGIGVEWRFELHAHNRDNGATILPVKK